MTSLVFQGRLSAPNESFDTAISDLEIVTAPGGLSVLVSVSRMGGGFASWSLEDPLPVLLRTRAAETTATTGYGPALMAYDTGVLAAGLTAGLVDAVPIVGGGDMDSPRDWTAPGGNWAHLAAAGDGVIALAEAQSNAVHLFRDTGSGALTEIGQISDTDQSHASFISAMTGARVAGRDLVFTGSGREQGISVYDVTGSGATLSATIGPESGLGLMVPTAMEVAWSGGQAFLVLGSAPGGGAGGALSVMAISDSGDLTPSDHVMDTLLSRFGAVQSLSVARYNDIALVVAGGGDDGVSLFLLSPEGRLVHLDALPDSTLSGLSNITDIETQMRGDVLYVYVTSEDTRGITVLSVDLSDLGEVLHAGGTPLAGTAGDDVLIDGAGADTLTGGSGADLYVIGADGGQTDHVQGFDPDHDRLDLGAWPFLYDPGALSITTTATGARIDWRGDRIVLYSVSGQALDPEAVRAAIVIDVNRSFQAPQVVAEGGAGDDSLAGSWGNDTLIGGAGNDLLDGGTGDDVIAGGAGSDTVVLAYDSSNLETLLVEGDRVTLDGGAGRDVIEGVEWFAFADRTVAFDALESLQPPVTLTGGSGADRLEETGRSARLEGGAGSDTLISGSGADSLIGGSGADSLTSDTGDDVLFGGDGADTIRAGRGDDTVEGGEGLDNIWGDGGNDTIRGGAGDDVLRGGRNTDLIYGDQGHDALRGQREGDTLYGGDGDDNLKGGGGNDWIYGEAGDDFLKGGTRRDLVDGGAGHDILNGNAGDDTLIGGAGHDVLRSGGNNDVLEGGAGNDTIKGGTGRDVFVFDTGHGADLITDFELGRDRLELSAALVGGLTTPEQVLSAFAELVSGGVMLRFSASETILLSGWQSLTGLEDQIDII